MRALKVALALIVLASTCFASKSLYDFPLEVAILETHWARSGYGVAGSGRGTISDGESIHGFDFTFECLRGFNASQGYAARWKKEGTRLSLLTVEIGDTSKRSECELKTTLISGVYGMRSGNSLVVYSQQQYQDMLAARSILSKSKNPSDVDPAHYPLGVSILESKWQPGQVGGMVGSGRGNIRNGDSFMAFEFNALCLGELNNSTAASAYGGRWVEEPKRLVILAHKIGGSEYQQCEFKTDVRPNNVYVRNSNSALLDTLTQQEFKIWREKRIAARATALQPEQPAKPVAASPSAKAKLTNDDVIAMVANGLSSDIVLAKIDASECSFDTTPNGLAKLKAAKVPNPIVLVMIKKS